MITNLPAQFKIDSIKAVNPLTNVSGIAAESVEYQC